MVLLTLQPWASAPGEETEQSMEERGGKERRRLRSTSKKPPLQSPLTCCPGLPVATVTPAAVCLLW